MNLIKVNVISAQPAKTAIHRVHQVLAREANVVGTLSCGDEPLGGDHEIVAMALHRLSDDLLRVTGVVGVGCVDEVDSVLKRGFDHADSPSVINIPRAEHICPQANPGDFKP